MLGDSKKPTTEPSVAKSEQTPSKSLHHGGSVGDYIVAAVRIQE